MEGYHVIILIVGIGCLAVAWFFKKQEAAAEAKAEAEQSQQAKAEQAKASAAMVAEPEPRMGPGDGVPQTKPAQAVAPSAEIIDGYKLQNLMMTGQSSQVWEVVEISSNRHFAMKLLLPEKAKVSEFRRMMAHEANVGKQLAHQNVIKIVHVGQDKKHPYFVMEFFPAGSLKLRIVRKQYDFIKERALSIFKQAATGLAYMNASGWVHRDVKPDNLLVNSGGELRIIDFALAQHVEQASFLSKLLRRKPSVAGTRSYMSPEQIRGEPLDGRADIYSFGCTVYELLTYRPPFRAASMQELLQKHILEKPPSPQVHNADVTDELSELVLRMLAKKREQRPQSFHEVLKGLHGIRVYKSDPVAKK